MKDFHVDSIAVGTKLKDGRIHWYFSDHKTADELILAAMEELEIYREHPEMHIIYKAKEKEAIWTSIKQSV
jgi:hypothetical protein